ncbi:MAG: sodium:calcium antiporter [Chloroflexi bacterium]|nr:sodium:calcium antiporter [Chloroflexota bacterium]
MPAGVLRLISETLGLHLVGPEFGALIFGVGIVASAFLLTWASEVAELDISQALALAFVALIAVLPEYAVDLYFAWQAGADPAGPYVHYATANMTGANRLLVGLAWPLVGFLFWFRSRQPLRRPPVIHLSPGLSLELVFMGLATLYAFTIPFKGGIALWDSVVLVGLFAAYIWLLRRAEHVEPELVGPPRLIAQLRPGLRRLVVAAMYLFAAGVIFAAAEPFAESLLDVGKEIGVDEFIIVQWVAPLASEAPEILVAAIFTLRGQAGAAMAALISAKVNQWTLLVGTLPIAYIVSLGHFSLAGIPLDPRQMEEIWLTAAQSFLAVCILATLRFTLPGAATLFVLWATQLGFTSTVARYIYTFLYLGIALGLLAFRRGQARALLRLWPEMVSTVRANARGGQHK